MKPHLHAFAAAVSLAIAASAGPALAQKAGGVLKLPHFDSPASMSILEEATRATVQPMMGVFNNLVLYDQQIAQSSLETVRPDLATSWSWSEDGKELTFPLRQGVKWHDGKPFTAADVKCTWDLVMGTGSDKLRVNLALPRPGARHAPAPDRQRAVQIRRVQTQRTDHGDKEPGLLEAGAAL